MDITIIATGLAVMLLGFVWVAVCAVRQRREYKAIPVAERNGCWHELKMQYHNRKLAGWGTSTLGLFLLYFSVMM